MLRRPQPDVGNSSRGASVQPQMRLRLLHGHLVALLMRRQPHADVVGLHQHPAQEAGGERANDSGRGESQSRAEYDSDAWWRGKIRTELNARSMPLGVHDRADKLLSALPVTGGPKGHIHKSGDHPTRVRRRCADHSRRGLLLVRSVDQGVEAKPPCGTAGRCPDDCAAKALLIW
jgi:hypothetical protein